MKRLLFKICMAVPLALLCAQWAQANVTLNANYFPDANFRAALTDATGVAEGGTINEATLTELDVSNQGITDLTGLGLLTGLTTLDISDNDLTTGANITGLRSLTTLKASNCNLVSLGGTTGTSDVTHVTGSGLTISANNVNLIYLDISHNPNFYSSSNLQYLTKLETLVMHHCTNFDYWGTPGNYMSSLKYVDVSYCTNMDRIFLPAASRLEVLKAVGLTKLKGFKSESSWSSSQQYYIVLKHQLATLKWLDVSECSQLKNVYLRYCTNMQHLNASGTMLSGFSSSATLSDGEPTDGYIQLPTGLTTLEYLNLANCSSLDSFRAIKETYQITCIDTLILTNDTHLGWSNVGFEAQTHMTYLDVTNCGIKTTGSYIPNFDNLKDLETLLYGENLNVGYLRITGNSHLKTLDLHGNTGMTMLALDHCGMPRTNLAIDDTNCPALTGLKLNNNGYSSISEAMGNATALGLDHIQFLYLENNSGFSGGPLTLNENDCAGLKGIDLGNNGFTSFTAQSLPPTLTALMIGKNPGMKRLEMHNNPGINTMTADTVMSDGSGLYLLGNAALTYMDISGTADQPNYFERIGNNGSLENVPIDTIKASYNKFYTFRNLEAVPGNIYEYWGEKYTENGQQKIKNVYYMSSNGNLESTYRYKSYWPAMPAMPDSASLEQLPNLRYLDLSHCNLKDSVYLHKNTDLRYLDVSHNRKIARSFTTQNKGAGYRAHIESGGSKTSYPDYKKYLWLVSNTNDREPYTNDCNDTTGLYILDLMDNNLLEYLDISYTGIEQTAMTHCHVANARYIWIQDLPELKYFYSDYNGMRSMGIGTLYGKKRASAYASTAGLKSLERLSSIGMRGTDKTTMQGSINFRENTVCTKLHYINLAYSRYDSVGVYIPTVDTLILRGNPIHYVNAQKINDITYLDLRECAFKMRGYDAETGDIFFPNVNDYKNGARIDGVYYTNSTNIPASNPSKSGDLTTPFSGLRGVRAYKRPKLTTVLLDNSNALREVYCFEDSVLPKIYGFENLAYNLPWDGDYNLPTQDADSLMIVKVNDNPEFIDLKLHKNDTLLYLYAYNDRKLGPALGENGMNLTNNKYLRTAWVSNSLLERFVNDAKEHLDTLYIWQNPQLAELDVTKNTQLRHFDLHNCMINELDVSKNTQLVKFDCSNQDSIWVNTFYDHYNYRMPAAVPTSMTQPGRNSIADLHFSSHSLKIVHADKNDLYCMTGLSQNPNLDTLTYSYNHINAIDLSGCSSLPANADLTHYDCRHNVRGIIPGELAAWYTQDEGSTTKTKHELYYFQLDDNAGDELPSMPNSYNTFLGSKEGQDSLRIVNGIYNPRELTADGFDPTKVEIFDVNSSGPHDGQRTNADNGASGAPMRATEIIDPSDQLDLSTIYGKIVVLKYMNKDRNYVEYLYRDGRTSGNRAEGLSRFGLVWYAPDTPTDVEETLADGFSATVVSERYYDTAGVEHSQPVKGVNIVVRQMSDGSTQTVKILK